MRLLEKLQNGKITVIYVAKAWGLAFFGMVKAPRPIDGYIWFTFIYKLSAD